MDTVCLYNKSDMEFLIYKLKNYSVKLQNQVASFSSSDRA